MMEYLIRGISLNRHLPIIVKGLGDCENVKTKYAFRPQQYVSNTQVPAKILKAKITVKKRKPKRMINCKDFRAQDIAIARN